MLFGVFVFLRFPCELPSCPSPIESAPDPAKGDIRPPLLSPDEPLRPNESEAWLSIGRPPYLATDLAAGLPRSADLSTFYPPMEASGCCCMCSTLFRY